MGVSSYLMINGGLRYLVNELMWFRSVIVDLMDFGKIFLTDPSRLWWIFEIFVEFSLIFWILKGIFWNFIKFSPNNWIFMTFQNLLKFSLNFWNFDWVFTEFLKFKTKFPKCDRVFTEFCDIFSGISNFIENFIKFA